MLTEKERNLIAYCEQAWFLEGRLPTPETLIEKFDYTPKALNQVLHDEEVVKSFEARGMPIVEGRDLTPEQITVINTMLNLADQRSERKKLSEMGISAKTWAGWKKNPKVQAYIARRSTSLLRESLPDAHLALVDNVRRGDLGSLKFLYEVTGTYTGNEKQLDIRMILEKVLEIIQTHVTEPATLLAIANDFKLLVALDKPGTIDTVVQQQTLEL